MNRCWIGWIGKFCVLAVLGCTPSTVVEGSAATSSTENTMTGAGGADSACNAMTGAGGAGNGVSGSGGSAGAGLGPGQCHTEADCMNTEFCRAPGESLGCGICLDPEETCTDDSECTSVGDSFICKPAACACSGQKVCVPGCTGDDQCEAWEFCAPTHRCVSKPCQFKDSNCPKSFVCLGFEDPFCSRKPCAKDADCQGGYCVKQQCYDAPGSCTPPVP